MREPGRGGLRSCSPDCSPISSSETTICSESELRLERVFCYESSVTETLSQDPRCQDHPRAAPLWGVDRQQQPIANVSQDVRCGIVVAQDTAQCARHRRTPGRKTCRVDRGCCRSAARTDAHQPLQCIARVPRSCSRTGLTMRGTCRQPPPLQTHQTTHIYRSEAHRKGLSYRTYCSNLRADMMPQPGHLSLSSTLPGL